MLVIITTHFPKERVKTRAGKAKFERTYVQNDYNYYYAQMREDNISFVNNVYSALLH